MYLWLMLIRLAQVSFGLLPVRLARVNLWQRLMMGAAVELRPHQWALRGLVNYSSLHTAWQMPMMASWAVEHLLQCHTSCRQMIVAL